MTNEDFQVYYDLYFVKLRIVQRIARKLARDDDELAEDLIQEGLLRLSNLNPGQATSNTDAWIRQSLKFAMVDYLRKNNPQRYDSLDQRLLAGDQLESDPATGELRLLTSRMEHTAEVDAPQLEQETSDEYD